MYHRANLTIPRDVPKLGHLQGAVQRVIINGEVFDKLMESDIEQQNVAIYRGPPCGSLPVTHSSSALARATYSTGKDSSSSTSSTPCQNGGVCQPLLSSFVCKCQTGFLGKRCEKREWFHNYYFIDKYDFNLNLNRDWWSRFCASYSMARLFWSIPTSWKMCKLIFFSLKAIIAAFFLNYPFLVHSCSLSFRYVNPAWWWTWLPSFFPTRG